MLQKWEREGHVKEAAGKDRGTLSSGPAAPDGGHENQVVAEGAEGGLVDRGPGLPGREFNEKGNASDSRKAAPKRQEITLGESLLDTTLLVEQTHEKLTSIVEDLEEGIRIRAFEFRSSTVDTPDTEASSQHTLDRVERILTRLESSRMQMNAAVAALRIGVDKRVPQSQVSEDMYKSIFRRVKDGIFITDADWNITEVNPAMCEMLSCKYRRVAASLNIRDDIFADPSDFEIFEKNVIVSGFKRSHETKLRSASGSIIDVIVSCTAIWDDDDTLIGYEGVVHDITEHKRIEDERLKLQRLEAVHNMVITINHNMNQNLTVIYNYCQLLKDLVEGNESTVEYFDGMYKEVEKLIDLVSKITRIKDIHTVEYVGGVRMIDLERSIDGN